MENAFDILILGAGLGGLECAYILSKKGYKVSVLEKNINIGGTLQDFQLADCTFSSGMHYLGSLDEGQVLNKLFRYFNILDDLKLKRMDEDGFDSFNIGDREIEYPMGWDNFRKKLSSYFPSEKQAVNAYVNLINAVVEKQDIYNLRPFQYRDIRKNKFLNTGIYPVIKSITKNKDLQNALCALNFVYAGEKNTSSLYTHALINNYYVKSAYRLIGGSGQIADLFASNIRQLGGEIHTQKEVNQFVFEDDKLVGVKLKNGDIVHGKHIISNIHPATTMGMIPKERIRKSFRNRLMEIPNTISVFGLHLKLKPGTVPYLNTNYYYYKNNSVWPVTEYNPDKWPQFYYLYTPAATANDRFAQGVSIYTYMQFDELKDWTQLPVNHRGKSYDNWKKEKAGELINLVSIKFPEIRENIVDWIATTPLTYRDYIGSPNGAIYGAKRDYHDPMRSFVSARTKIPNLFFTGQNINLHGMLGVTMSALITCSEFVELNDLIKEINEA